MRGVISAPRGVIQGAFNIRFAFQEDIDLTADDVIVMPIEGDALGHAKDTFGGSGKDYHILCYIPDARKGRSRISVIKDGVDVSPVFVEYDTVRTVIATFGTPIKRGSKVEVPVSFDSPVRNLKKRNFQVTPSAAFQLYGLDYTYTLLVASKGRAFSVYVAGAVVKANGVRAGIQETVIDVPKGVR